MNPPPNMTQEQLRELKQLRKEEAKKTKAMNDLANSIHREMSAQHALAEKLEKRANKEYTKAIKAINGTRAAALKPLRTRLAKLKEGRIPEAAALKAIRRRIAILEGRTTS